MILKTETHNLRYVSIYGSTKKLLPQQHLAELMIKRRADKDNTILPDKFWSDKSTKYTMWREIFNRELRFASSILKKASIESAIKVFNSKEGSFFLTFSNPKFHALVEREEQKRKQEEYARSIIQNETDTSITLTDVNKRPNNPGGKKKNILGKLRGL